ncbi:hypothetical protein F3J23_07450 [Chryseobacterium sp. Tr-659]|uniref:hypothetical protein n=1 Tax=Chryseobacterium sp. Tr-659 TaxID=2608340 RepID=UPI0014232415|nr:hypothetical protein [Chryseobacterium sp. Tr-659]NIF05276.1 hypothetical protein [Chryseobacterium sp. Tr-659]
MKLFTYLSVVFFTFSCRKSDCNNVKLAFYSDDYNIIVEEQNIDLTWIKINGFAPVAHKKTNIMVHNNWIVDSNEVEVGDTIVKKKGELAFAIHKKDTIINHDWYCEGKLYK